MEGGLGVKSRGRGLGRRKDWRWGQGAQRRGHSRGLWGGGACRMGIGAHERDRVVVDGVAWVPDCGAPYPRSLPHRYSRKKPHSRGTQTGVHGRPRGKQSESRIVITESWTPCPASAPGLLLTIRHHFGGGTAPPPPWTHPSHPPHPLKDWAKFSFRPLANQNVSLAPI